MKRMLLAACLVSLCGTAEAQQVIIGNSVAAPYLAGTNFGTKSVGFRTGSSGLLLEDIQVALGGESSGGGTLTFTLNDDNFGVPGIVIAQIGSATVVPWLPTGKNTIKPSQPLVLNPNTVYWIQAVFPSPPSPSPNWDQTNPPIAPSSPSGLAAFVGYNFNGGPSSTFNAIIVDGIIGGGGVTAKTSGTAARAILTGLRCGQAITPVDKITGGFGVDGFSDASTDHVGSISAAGILPITGPRVGAFVTTNNIVSAASRTPLGVGVGGARAIAYGKYRNDSIITVTPPALATLDGDFFTQPSQTLRLGLCANVDAEFSGSPGHATAAVYVFDAVKFENALNNAGMTMPEFLLGGDMLNDYQIGTAASLSLTRLSSLSAALLFEEFREVDPATFSSGTTIGSPLLVGGVAPGQSVIVVFDITGYSPPGAQVRFINTLKPAPGFMAGMTAVGPWTPSPPSAASLTLSPAATTNPITTPVTVTATARTASGAPVPNTLVFFDITGPNAQPLAPAMTDAQGQVTLTYPGGGIAGTDVIEATIGTLQSNFAQLTWTIPGPLDHISISPASATITAGGAQSYTVQALDLFDNSIGDVTAGTTLTISPDGSCTGATCTASVAGMHTVSGTYSGQTATATLNVANVAPAITAQPSNQTVCAGQSASFMAAASGTPSPTAQWQVSTDGGASFADVSGATSVNLTFTPAGSQNGNRYRAVFTNVAGSATSSAATLTVNTSPAVTAQPSSQTVAVGQNVSFIAASSGSPTPAVQWQVSSNGGSSFIDISGATSTTLSFTASGSQNGTLYRAVFTNACGTASSSAATLTIGSAAGARFYPLASCRVVDTRNPGGPRGGPGLSPNTTRVFPVTGACGIPATAVAVSANLAVIPIDAGSLTLYPGNASSPPGTSSLNFNAGRIRANNVMALLATDGSGTLAVYNASGTENQLILDISGYFK